MYELGLYYIKYGGDIEQAILSLENASKDNHGPAMKLLGDIFYDDYQYEKSIQYYTMFINYTKTTIVSDELKQHADWLDPTTGTEIPLEHDKEPVKILIGQCYFKNGQAQLAIDWFKNCCITADTAAVDYAKKVAFCMVQAGNVEDAVEIYIKLHKITDDDKHIDKVLALTTPVKIYTICVKLDIYTESLINYISTDHIVKKSMQRVKFSKQHECCVCLENKKCVPTSCGIADNKHYNCTDCYIIIHDKPCPLCRGFE